MKLPAPERLLVEREKIIDYLLNSAHRWSQQSEILLRFRVCTGGVGGVTGGVARAQPAM